MNNPSQYQDRSANSGSREQASARVMGEVIDGSQDYDPVEVGQKLVERIDSNRGFTTSQLRKILSAAAVVKNRIDREVRNTDKLNRDIQAEVQYIRLKLVYQMGRDNNVKIGLVQSGVDLPSVIKNIGDSKEKFENFYRLLESIVAYRKFNENSRN